MDKEYRVGEELEITEDMMDLWKTVDNANVMPGCETKDCAVREPVLLWSRVSNGFLNGILHIICMENHSRNGKVVSRNVILGAEQQNLIFAKYRINKDSLGNQYKIYKAIVPKPYNFSTIQGLNLWN